MTCPASLCQRPVFCSDFWENRFPPQSRTKPQHCVSFPRRCTDAIRLAGGANKPLHGPTRGFAVLGCCVRRRQTVIGREWPDKNCCLISVFQILAFSACCIGCLYDYGVVKFSHQLFSKMNFSKAFPFFRQGLFLIVIRLVYIFPPQIPEGSPSGRRRAVGSAKNVRADSVIKL